MKQEEVKAGDKLHIKVSNEFNARFGELIEVEVLEVMNYNKPPYQYFAVTGQFMPIPATEFEEFKPKDNA